MPEPTQAVADEFMRLTMGVDGPPVCFTPPIVSGVGAVGQTLTATTPGTWWGGSRAPTSAYNYRWRRSGFGPDLGTATTYVIVAADSGHSVSVYSTATNSFGSAESLPSNPVAVP
jgi:hypothetical protein